jgi:hypothetical protein
LEGAEDLKDLAIVLSFSFDPSAQNSSIRGKVLRFSIYSPVWQGDPQRPARVMIF